MNALSYLIINFFTDILCQLTDMLDIIANI
jgi:hypothetical protein